jgi:hypothetical protein
MSRSSQWRALGITDDEVRAGIEMGSRFFKEQADLLKVNAVAADVAAITGGELVDVISSNCQGSEGSDATTCRPWY